MHKNIMDNILIAIKNVEFKDKRQIKFKDFLQLKLEKAILINNGFEEVQNDLERFLNDNKSIAIEFFKILKGYYLRKLMIEKTRDEEDFRVFSSLKAFENRFLNKDKDG